MQRTAAMFSVCKICRIRIVNESGKGNISTSPDPLLRAGFEVLDRAETTKNKGFAQIRLLDI